MWVYFNENGQLITSLEHGTIARVGTTAFSIFVVFDNIDNIDKLREFSATIKLRKPDLTGSSYPVLLMSRATSKFVKLSGEGDTSPFENGKDYYGFLFDFGNFNTTDEEEILLDTDGLWTATVTLINGDFNVQGAITFEVGGTGNEDETTISYDIITNQLEAAINERALKEQVIITVDSTNPEDLILSDYENGQMFYAKAENLFYKLVDGILVPQPIDMSIDDELSLISIHPVQNKVVTAALVGTVKKYDVENNDWDLSPTASSTKPVTSDGIRTALNGKVDFVSATASTTLSTLLGGGFFASTTKSVIFTLPFNTSLNGVYLLSVISPLGFNATRVEIKDLTSEKSWLATGTTNMSSPVGAIMTDSFRNDYALKNQVVELYSQNSQKWDTYPKNGSLKPVTSGGIYNTLTSYTKAPAYLTATQYGIPVFKNTAGNELATSQFVIDDSGSTKRIDIKTADSVHLGNTVGGITFSYIANDRCEFYASKGPASKMNLGNANFVWSEAFINKLIDRNGNSVEIEDIESKDNRVTSITSSSTNYEYPTAKAVYDLLTGLPAGMVFKGTVGTGGTVTNLPTADSTNNGWTYMVITAGTYQGLVCSVGDTVVSDGTSWTRIPSGGANGTVTSIGISGSTAFRITGSPVTTSGTINISLADGYMIPTQTQEQNWNNKVSPSTLVNYVPYSGATTDLNLGEHDIVARTITAHNYIAVRVSNSTAYTGINSDGTIDVVDNGMNLWTFAFPTSKTPEETYVLATTDDLTDKVVGPATASDGCVALFDGYTGKLIKNSNVSINSSDNTTRITGGDNNLVLQATHQNGIKIISNHINNGGLIIDDVSLVPINGLGSSYLGTSSNPWNFLYTSLISNGTSSISVANIADKTDVLTEQQALAILRGN